MWESPTWLLTIRGIRNMSRNERWNGFFNVWMCVVDTYFRCRDVLVLAVAISTKLNIMVKESTPLSLLRWHQKHALVLLFTFQVYIYVLCTYCSFTFAVTCTPACQNGGFCNSSSSSPSCVCPSGYSGAYCQERGIMYAWISFYEHTRSNWSMKPMISI